MVIEETETRRGSWGFEMPYCLTVSERDEKLIIFKQGISIVFLSINYIR